MSGQDIGFFSAEGACADLVIENGDLKADNGLETAVLISLFTDGFVDLEDLPEGETNPRGWWADQVSNISTDQIGSKLWLFDRSKILENTESGLETFAKEALKWMLDDGIATTVSAVATRIDKERIDLSIEIVKPTGDSTPFQFIWDGQDLKRQEAA